MPSILNALLNAGDSTMMVKLATVRAAIDLEPEVPGDMPDEMWEALRNDRDAMRQAFVITVKETKVIEVFFY